MKYLSSEARTDLTAFLYDWSPERNVLEFASLELLARIPVGIGPSVILSAGTFDVLRDTQLASLLLEVLTVLTTFTVSAGTSLDWIVSVALILMALTISPYSLLSISAVADAPVPPNVFVKEIVGAEEYPLPPLYPLASIRLIATISPPATTASADAAT